MKNILKILLYTVAFALVTATSGAQSKTSPKRMGNQIPVTFDTPPSVALKEAVRYYPACPDTDVKLDVYYPKAAAKDGKKYPCILVIHGGGWRMGNEKKFAMFSAFVASNGYVVACISYRLLPEYQMEDCVEDCKRALFWLKKNAAEFGGDPQKIGVTGGSAGGQLSALLATSGDSDLFKNVFEDGIDSQVQACVAMAPVTDFNANEMQPRLKSHGENYTPELAARLAKISPINYVDKKSPPMLLLHSKGDKTVPVSQSEDMKAAYDKLGLKCETVYFDSSDHAFWNTKPQDPTRLQSWNLALEFFNKTLK